MEMPAVPRHDVCPTEVKLVATDDEPSRRRLPPKPHPFAALQKLKADKGN
jgi:uncharacterized protein